MKKTFTARNGSVFHYWDNMVGEIEVDAKFPTRVAIDKDLGEIGVFLSAEDLMEFVLHRLRAEEIIHFTEDETEDLIHHLGKHRSDEH